MAHTLSAPAFRRKPKPKPKPKPVRSGAERHVLIQPPGAFGVGLVLSLRSSLAPLPPSPRGVDTAADAAGDPDLDPRRPLSLGSSPSDSACPAALVSRRRETEVLVGAESSSAGVVPNEAGDRPPPLR
ncbi:hypothetical protein GUJ93_ZPchr0012g21439 [Zizania palustris]|uniref:Uncharacterized protein n=1 Tax=Zizania palustris TaxID=103762 RepID=A0A8J6BSU9_ZIZPA|nr:hypothetical protein GUJ93_ZPchr0012g21439 [Zizania palustris]